MTVVGGGFAGVRSMLSATEESDRLKRSERFEGGVGFVERDGEDLGA